MKRDVYKSKIQESQYDFPYHYIPYFEDNKEKKRRNLIIQDEEPKIARILNWGLDYLIYNKVIVEIIKLIKVKSILDFGCGDGRLLKFLEDILIDKVGVDYSKKALRFAYAFNPDVLFYSKIEDINRNFDCITLIEVLEHIPDNEISLIFKEIYNRLNSDGHLIISVPTTNVPLNPKHIRHYNLQLLKKQLSNKWKIKWFSYFSKVENSNIIIKKLKHKLFLIFPALLKYEYRRKFFANEKNGSHLIAICSKI